MLTNLAAIVSALIASITTVLRLFEPPVAKPTPTPRTESSCRGPRLEQVLWVVDPIGAILLSLYIIGSWIGTAVEQVCQAPRPRPATVADGRNASELGRSR